MDLKSFFNDVVGLSKELKQYTRPWNFTVDIVFQSQILTYLPGTTGFLFTNIGAVNATVNGKILFPGTPGTILGDAFAVAAHKDDVYKGIIKIQFAAGAGAALEVMQVYYMDVKQR